MQATLKKEYISPKDIFIINKILGLGISVQNHVAYVKTTRNDIARETKVSLKTVTRKLQQYGDLSLISFEKKLGAKGGLIIKLNPEKFNFTGVKSALTNPTKKETKLVNRLFPSYNKKVAIRRTKTEMAEYRELKRTMSNKTEKANNLLITEYIGKKDIDWDFFRTIDDSEHVYKVWLLSRVYDSMVDTYEKYYTEEYHNVDNGYAIGYEKEKHSAGYKSLNGAFIGSYNFKAFERLIEFSNEVKMSPAVIMSKVFERYRYTHVMYNKKAKIPVPNQLVDKNGKRIFKEALFNQRATGRFNGTLAIDMGYNPELAQVFSIYEQVSKEMPYQTTNQFLYEKEGLSSAYHYYNQVMFNISQEGASYEEARVIDFYIHEQYKIKHTRIPSVAIGTEIGNYVVEMVKEQGYELEDNAIARTVADAFGTEISSENRDINWYKKLGTYANKKGIALEVTRVDNQRQGHSYTMAQIAQVVDKYQKYFPVSKSGMLKFEVINTQF